MFTPPTWQWTGSWTGNDLLFPISSTFPRLMGVHKWIYSGSHSNKCMGEEEEKAQEETELTVPILKRLIIQSERQNTYMKLLKNNFNYPNLGEGRGSSMSM